MTPALPPGFKLDPIPDLPAGFKLDPVEPTKEEAKKKDDRLPFGVPGGREHKTFAETVGPESTLGKAATFLGKASQFVPKAETVMGMSAPLAEGAQVGSKLATFGRSALGLGAAVGTGTIVDKSAQALGLGAGTSAALGAVAGAAVGSRVGLSPETVEAIHAGGGPLGFVRKLIHGPSSKDDAAVFFKLVRGRAPEGLEKIQAENYLKEFKRVHTEGGDEAGAKFVEELKAGSFKGKPPKPAKTPKEEPRPGSGATVHKFGGSADPLRGLGGTRPLPKGKIRTDFGSIHDEPTPEPVEPWKPFKGKSSSFKSSGPPDPLAGLGGTRGPQRVGKIIGRMESREAEAEEKADELIEKTTKQPLKPKGGKGEEAPSGVTPMGKLKIRADIFSNVDQLAAKAGTNKVEFKKSFRDIVEKKYGKGLSEMNEEELMQVANSVQDLLKK